MKGDRAGLTDEKQNALEWYTLKITKPSLSELMAKKTGWEKY